MMSNEENTDFSLSQLCNNNTVIHHGKDILIMQKVLFCFLYIQGKEFRNQGYFTNY